MQSLDTNIYIYMSTYMYIICIYNMYIYIYYTVFVLIRFHGKISHLLGWNQVVLFLFSATSCDAMNSWTFWTVKKLQLLGFASVNRKLRKKHQLELVNSLKPTYSHSIPIACRHAAFSDKVWAKNANLMASWSWYSSIVTPPRKM